MATKRTKTDKAQRQADQLEKKTERQAEQGTSRRKGAKTLAEQLDRNPESRSRNFLPNSYRLIPLIPFSYELQRIRETIETGAGGQIPL
jgi:hypothetical protein